MDEARALRAASSGWNLRCTRDTAVDGARVRGCGGQRRPRRHAPGRGRPRGDRAWGVVRPVPHQSARRDGATSAHKKFIGSAVNKAPATQGAAHNMISTSILYPSSGGTSVGACPVKWPCGRRACSPASSLGWAAWRAHSSTPAALSLLAACVYR